MRREDVGDGSAAEGGGAHGLDGQGHGEEPPPAEDDRVDDEAVLVDQADLRPASARTVRRPGRVGTRRGAPA